MTRIRCATCGELHDLSNSDVGYQHPDAYRVLPVNERERRGRCGSDLCELDGRRFLRGVIALPIRAEGRDFGWGVWAEVSPEAFDRYRELWSDPDQHLEPAFAGRLANELPGYPSTTGLELRITLTSPAQRPAFEVHDPDHALAREQREGIRLERVLELLGPFLH